MAFRSNSYTRLCSASGQQTEETTGKPQHTASVEHIDFRKAFDFADRCSREGSKSVEKLSAFKPVYVRRPVQALHSFDSLSASPDLSVDTPKMKSEPAISQCSKRNEHLEGTAGELQRVFDQLAAQLEQEANELRKEARERSPSLRQVGLLRANSDCGSSPARKIRTQDLDASLVTNENNTRLSDSSANTPHTSLKPPLSRGSVSPVHAKGGHRREDRRGSTGECNNSAWNKSSSSNKASYSLSSSPVRERFAARRRADSLERVRDVNKTGQDQDKDGEKVVVAQRRTQWDGARDMDTSIVSQRKLALERKSNVDVSVPSHRRPSFDKDGDTSLLFKRRASLERNVNSAGSPNRRSSSRERAEARLAALQKLSANREKFEDYVPRSQRNGKVTPKEICSRERSHSLRSNQQDASNADSQLTEFVDKRSLTPDYNERSPVYNDRYGAVEPSMSTNVELGDESLQNNRTEKFDEIKLQKVALSREISPSGDVYSGKAIHVKSGFSFSAEVESPPALRIELPPSGERQPPGSSLKAPHDKDDQYLFRPLSQDSDHRLHGVPANTEHGSSSTDFNVSIHSDPKSLNLPDRNSPLVQSSSNEPASSIADEVQTAASVHSQSLSSSTESLPSSNAEETAVDLDFPQVLDKVVTRYELERRLEQEATEGNPPLKEDKPNVCVRAEPVYTPVENTDRMQKIKVSNFFSDDNLSYKRDSAKCGNGIRTQTSAEPPKLSFVNPEMPGYVGFANLPNQVHRKSVKKGFEFTLMVVGESGLGKSTLINSLFMTDLYPERNIPSAAERIEKTVSIEASTVEIEERGVRLRLTVVDTPGYADSMNSTDCFKPIIKYVDDQFEKYLRDESGLNRKNIVDNRIHACFYFINPVGHGLKPLDIIFMKALHHKVNIVPVIAKADTLSKHEVARLKKKVLEEIEENGINIYALPDCDAEEDESYKQSCEELKAAVPFAVVGSNQVMDVGGRKVRARAYPWGVVEVENPDHCDFIKLRTMFITHMQDLQEVTHDVHYENFRSQRLASEPPKIRTSKPHSREVDSILSEQDRLLQERELKLRKMEEELQKVKEQMMKQQISVASENVEKKPVTHISTAINGQTNDKLTKKAPIVQMNQV